MVVAYYYLVQLLHTVIKIDFIIFNDYLNIHVIFNKS